MTNKQVERERVILEDGTEAFRYSTPHPSCIIDRVVNVEYGNNERVLRYSINLTPKMKPLGGQVLIAAPTGTPSEAILADVSLSYGRSVRIAHGTVESALRNALAMKETYYEDQFFSGISFAFQSLDKIDLFHEVTGDKDRFKGVIALGESMEHPTTWAAFPYRYSADRRGDLLVFSRIWEPTAEAWRLEMQEGLNEKLLFDQVTGLDWPQTREKYPVNLVIGK